MGYPDTRLWPIFRIIYSGPFMAVVPPLSPPRDFPVRAPCLQPLCPRVHLSLLLLSPLCPLFRLVVFPPVAPVVTHRPPELTGGRCHAAPVVLSSFPMGVGVHPPTCAAGGTWLGCWWRGLGDGSPCNGLESLISLPVVARVACCFKMNQVLVNYSKQ